MAGLRVGCFQSPSSAAPDLADGEAFGERFAWAASFADLRLDRPREQRFQERLGGVAAIGPQLVGMDPALGERVDQRQQVPLLVLVSGREAYLERGAVGVYGEMDAAAGAAT